jgi:hypothetical protein
LRKKDPSLDAGVFFYAAFNLILTARATIEEQASGVSKPRRAYGRKAMNWFSRTTLIAGMQVSNWILAIVAAVVLWMIYSAFIH